MQQVDVNRIDAKLDIVEHFDFVKHYFDPFSGELKRVNDVWELLNKNTDPFWDFEIIEFLRLVPIMQSIYDLSFGCLFQVN